MSGFLGIDTSNYTTSMAYVKEGVVVKNLRRVLDVKEGERGLRQSDAVFSHILNIPLIALEMGKVEFSAVGVSSKPRDIEGSYMPCFLSGVAEAEALSKINGVPLYRFSHQAGHIAAALYSCGRQELMEKEFLSFHVSGGTTELLRVKNGKIEKLGGTLDISAGKAVDRIGVKLGIKFPCGKALEILSDSCVDTDCFKNMKICVNGFDCNLSGLENKADELIKKGAPYETVSAYTMEFIFKTIKKMTENALSAYPGLPVIYAGGVMSNRMLKNRLGTLFGGFFAEPQYSCDNAAGIALLCMYEWEKDNG